MTTLDATAEPVHGDTSQPAELLAGGYGCDLHELMWFAKAQSIS